jgi:hypothetical protein
MNVDEIVSIIGRPMQRSNRFSVSGFPGGDAVDKLCCDAPSPGGSYGTFIWKNAGPGINLPYEYLIDGFRFEFWDDEAKSVSNGLFGWWGSVVDDNFKFNFLSEYARDITINEVGWNGQVLQSRKLINAWCKSYETVQMSMNATNDLKKIIIEVVCERIE